MRLDDPGSGAERGLTVDRLPRPLFVFAGRISPDKDLERLCTLDLPGSTLLVGDGPDRRRLQSYYGSRHGVYFAGPRSPAALAEIFAAADAFVSPSQHERFALNWIEAMSTGLPIAAFDVPGRDLIRDGVNGAVGDDLREQALRCLGLDRDVVAATTERWSWRMATEEFLSHLAPMRDPARLGTAGDTELERPVGLEGTAFSASVHSV